MKALTGTAKQVIFAEKIRTNLYKGLELIKKELDSKPFFAKIILDILESNSASCFIDYKNHQFSICNFVKGILTDAYYDDKIEDDDEIDEYIEKLEIVFDKKYTILRNAGKKLDFIK